MKKAPYILIAAIMLLSSCGKKNFADDILKMQSSPIDLTSCEGAVCYKNGMESIYNNVDSAYKLIIYIDSLSCSPCFVSHMSDYLGTVEELDSAGIRTIFIFEPEKEKEEDVLSALKRFPTPLAALVIKNGVFALTNPHLSSTSVLHSFLLNRDNEIMIVGNPARNDKIKELMLNIVKTGKTQ